MCDSWYFYDGTFTFPEKAASVMHKLGLKNAKTYGYSWERVVTLLDNGCPIIIYGMPNKNIFQSHAWNIDGYKIKKRTITYKTYKGGTLEKEQTETEILNMVHCDFGWGRPSNGYYVSGVFNTKDSRIERDPNSDNEKNHNYNDYLHVIMYEKP